MTRRLIPLAVAAALVLALPASAHIPGPPVSRCAGSDAVVTRGDWQVIKKPEELAQVTSHAVGGLDGGVVLATDGRIVMRSTDGGCTWEEVYSTETSELPVDNREAFRIAQLVFPDPSSKKAAMVVDGVGQALGSRLLLSTDDGAEGSWEQADGLPLTGRYREVVGDGEQMYVVTGPRDEVAPATPGGGGLYVGDGRTFSAVDTGRPIIGIAPDPFTDRVFVVRSNHDVEILGGPGGPQPLAVSQEDPGNPAQQLDGAINDPEGVGRDKNPWRWVAYKRDPGSGVSVIALAASVEPGSKASRIIVSLDEGKNWTDLPVQGLGPIGGITFANSPAQLMVASGTDSSAQRGPGLIVYDLALQQFRDVDDLELASLYEPRLYPLSEASRGHPGLVGVQLRAHRNAVHEAPDLIARYIPPDPPPAQFLRARPCAERIEALEQEGVGGGERQARPPKLPSLQTQRHGGHDPNRPLRPGETHATPDPIDVRLEPGVAKRERLSVKLGAQPTPLDLGFLLDTSESMDPAIDGVLCSIERLARRLRTKGIDAEFGLAQYNDRIERRYRRILDLTPEPADLLATAKTLFTEKGAEEPIRTALFQVATGAGLQTKDQQSDDAPPTAPRNADVVVPPGQQLNFREDTERVVMVIGDEPYEETTEDEPSVDQVIEALTAKRVKAFGVQIEHPVIEGVSGDKGLNQPRPVLLRQQLETFARRSGAVAPRGGVDCDGGGRPDVEEGQPLVCGVDFNGVRDSIGDTIEALLLSAEERQTVKVVVENAGGLDVKVEDMEREGVNVRRESELAGAAVFACSAAQAGRRYPVSFAVMVAKRKVLSIPGSVTCGKLPSLAPSKTDPRAAAPAGPEQTKPTQQDPSGTPAPSGGPQAPSPNPAPSPQPQANPQAAAAATPPTPPPTPAPINSPSPVSTPSAAPSGAAAQASAPAASSAVAPAPGVVAHEEERSPGPQVAYADTGRGGEELAMVAVRERSRTRDRSAFPAPAAITLGAGICGAAGWLLLGAGRRRRGPQVERIRRP